MPGSVSQCVGVWVAVVVVGVSGMSQSVPKSACQSMLPGHDSFKPQMTPPPYTLTVSRPQGQDVVNVVLSGVGGAQFRGFFVKAFDSMERTAIGTFLPTPESTVIDCMTDTGVHHNSPADKSSVSLKWMPPKMYAGDVSFMATVVQTREVFWTGVVSMPADMS